MFLATHFCMITERYDTVNSMTFIKKMIFIDYLNLLLLFCFVVREGDFVVIMVVVNKKLLVIIKSSFVSRDLFSILFQCIISSSEGLAHPNCYPTTKHRIDMASIPTPAQYQTTIQIKMLQTDQMVKQNSIKSAQSDCQVV